MHPLHPRPGKGLGTGVRRAVRARIDRRDGATPRSERRRGTASACEGRLRPAGSRLGPARRQGLGGVDDAQRRGVHASPGGGGGEVSPDHGAGEVDAWTSTSAGSTTSRSRVRRRTLSSSGGSSAATGVPVSSTSSIRREPVKGSRPRLRGPARRRAAAGCHPARRRPAATSSQPILEQPPGRRGATRSRGRTGIRAADRERPDGRRSC